MPWKVMTGFTPVMATLSVHKPLPLVRKESLDL
jgi:hypothetical protein